MNKRRTLVPDLDRPWRKGPDPDYDLHGATTWGERADRLEKIYLYCLMMLTTNMQATSSDRCAWQIAVSTLPKSIEGYRAMQTDACCVRNAGDDPI